MVWFFLTGRRLLRLGQGVSNPISILPDAAPTIQTPNGSITWTMKGILARRLRTDTTVEQNFSVYSHL